MSTTTENLHLIKPAITDAVNIGDINDNMDTIDSAVGGLINTIYPVGSIYMSVASTNPGTLFGVGTWERIQDTFLLAAGSSYVPGATGGEATHTIIEDELPSISRTINFRKFAANGNIQNVISATGTTAEFDPNAAIAFNAFNATGTTTSTTSNKVDVKFGGDQPMNNMPPYLAVYVWKRTA